MDIDDSNIDRKLQKFKRGLHDVDSTVTTTAKKMGTGMAQEMKVLDNQAKQSTTTMANYGKELKKNETQTTTFGTKLKNFGSQFSTLGIGISTTMTSVVNLGRSYRDLEDTQIAVDRTARKMSLTQEAVVKAQGKLNELTSKGIKSGKEYQQAVLDVKQAQDAAAIASDVHAEAVEAQGDTYMNFAMSIVPTVIGAVSTMGAAMKEFGGKMDGVGDKLKGLKSNWMSFAGAAAGAGFALVIIQQVEAAQDALDAAGVKLQKFNGLLFATQSEMKKAVEEYDIIVEKTGLSLGQVLFGGEAVKKAWIDAGGAVDSAGNIIVETKTKVSDLGEGFTATTDDYARWAAAMEKDGKTRDEIIKWLTDSKIKLSDQAIILDKAAKITSQAAGAQAGLNKAVGEAVQIWFPEYILNMKKWRDQIQQAPKELDNLTAAMERNKSTAEDANTRLSENFKTWQSGGFMTLTEKFRTLSRLGSTTFRETFEKGADSVGKIMKGTKQYDDVLAQFNIRMRTTSFEADKLAQETLNLDDAYKKATDDVNKYAAGLEKQFDVLTAFMSRGIPENKWADQFTKALDPEKLQDKFKKDIEGLSFDAKLKTQLKFDVKREELKLRLQNLIDNTFEREEFDGQVHLVPRVDMTEKEAENLAKELIEKIDNSVAGTTPEMKNVKKRLQDAIDNADTAGALEDLFNDPKFLNALQTNPIKIEFSEAGLEALIKKMEAIFAKLNFPVKMTPAFEMSEADWEKAGLGEGPKYPGDHPPTFSDWFSTLTPEQKKAVNRVQRGTQSPPDSFTKGYGAFGDTQYAQPRSKWNYDQAPNFIDKNGNKWVIDPFTGKPYMVRRGDVFNRDVTPDNPAVGRQNALRPISYTTTGGGGGDSKLDRDFQNKLNQLAQPSKTNQLGDMMANINRQMGPAFQKVTQQFDLMIGRMTSASAAFATQWSSDMNSLAKNAASGGKQVTKQFDLMIGRAVSGFAAMATQWSSDMNSMGKNAQSANKQVVKQFDLMIGKATSGFAALASQWSSDMNSLINNAEAARDGVNDALAGIKDVDVTVRVGLSGPGVPFIRGAQGGMHETLGTDTLILAHAGERVDIQRGSRGGSTGGGEGGGGSSVIHLHNHLLTRDFETVYKVENGRMSAKYPR